MHSGTPNPRKDHRRSSAASVRARWRWAPIALLSCTLIACPSRDSVGTRSITLLGPGVVNNPSNKSLRFDILKFGFDSFCFEMMRRGTPLKLADDQPVLGRFFADTCQSQVLDDEHHKSLVVQYSGKGYGWTNLTERIGFTSSGLVEYAPDFQLHDGAMYIYFRPRTIDSTAFTSLVVESKVAQTGLAVGGVDPNQIGRRIVDSQLSRGFTVIRYNDSGETEFAQGLIPLGEKPFRPFEVRGSEKLTLANDRTEVHVGQQDFVGAFEVEDDDQALFLTVGVDGTPQVDLLLVPEGVGVPMIDQFVRTPGPQRVPALAWLDETISGQPPSGQAPSAQASSVQAPGATPALWQRVLPLAPGRYYVVIDHSSAAGQTEPAPGDKRAAKVDYLVQLGDKP